MTISIKASADGLSATLQVGGADKLTINSDGSLVATADPATGVRSKALATMQKFSDEFTSSLSVSGYQKLPSGLIVQWGTIAVALGSVNNNSANGTFPIAFPTGCLCIVGKEKSANANSANLNAAYFAPVSTTQFNANVFANATVNATYTFSYIAIGN